MGKPWETWMNLAIDIDIAAATVRGIVVTTTSTVCYEEREGRQGEREI